MVVILDANRGAAEAEQACKAEMAGHGTRWKIIPF